MSRYNLNFHSIFKPRTEFHLRISAYLNPALAGLDEAKRNQLCRVSRSRLLSSGTFRPRDKVIFCFCKVLHFPQISLLGQPVSEPQLKHGNIFSLTSTDYHLLRLTEENLIQIECSVHLIYRNHNFKVHNMFKIITH